jgi:16S rRNA (cytosine967-C5)-methyltransferase
VSRYHSYLLSSQKIILSFDGAEPFSAFIKRYFTANKKFGGNDRKVVTHLCYCYFRLGTSFATFATEERLLIALFLCSTVSNEVLQNLKPQWNEQVHLSIVEKLAILGLPFLASEVFPFSNELSKELAANAFALSHFVQPDLFLRIRPGQKENVLNRLKNAAVEFQVINATCVSLPNKTKVEGIIDLNKEAVVQDYNSQRVGELLQLLTINYQLSTFHVWDCCAASGGKSIMAYDLLPNIELTVSDIRDSILVNLQQRFAEAGIKKYNSLVLDLSTEQYKKAADSFHLIIADVPCTGSGTWGRTPEHLSFFKKQKIEEYALLQKKIISNIIPSLQQNGYLLYITCSVFEKENEEVVSFAQKEFGFELIEMKILKGYAAKADTMFAAVLRKTK